MLSFISKLFCETCWSCVIYKDTNILEKMAKVCTPSHKVVCGNRFWCADPFLIENGSETLLFTEIMDRNESRGKLGYARVDSESDIKIQKIIDFGCHTSYPDVFEINNTWYMIPETSARKTIELYRASNFPDSWEKICNLICNISAVDTTVFTKAGRLFIFIYEPNGKENTLSIGEIDIDARSVIKKKVVKQYHDRIGRPAGRIFYHQGRMIRPTQYGVNIYGEKIVFKEFTFDPNTFFYEEKDFSELLIHSIVDNSMAFGLHTYNRCNTYEVIDYCEKKFFLLKPISILLKKLRLFGYCYANDGLN